MKGVVDRGIVIPDQHAPLLDRPAINCLLEAIRIVKPSICVNLGDVGEWEGCSHWQWKKKRRPPLEYQVPFIDKDIEDVNEWMDELDEALKKAKCKRKVMVEGNHDDWMNRFVEENPFLKGYTFPEAVRLKERGWEYHKAGKYVRIGKLYFYHGHHFGGVYHSRNHLLKLGNNIMYGHWHDVQEMSITHLDGPKAAWSIGCLKDMSDEANEWLGNRKHNWAHAFAIVDWYDKGEFTVHLIRIIDGKCSLWGKIIDGNKKRSRARSR